ncbi:hypothetical protein Tco_1321277 [Tanacetum coccineum]
MDVYDIAGDDHGRVSQLFYEKFKNHDSNVDFPPFDNSSRLCALDRDSLKTHVSLDEVKNAVWDCGSSKAPDPNGFSFAFVKKYWDDIKVDILEYVNIFLDTGSLPHGSNSSFFTLIPKVSNPIFIKYFCLISLIGIHYKIIAKILANRIGKVIDKIVSHEQSAFIVGRQILDGPLILSDIVEWFKKVVNLQACLSLSRASVLVNGSPTSEFSIKRSLKQGDHLSPFIFILVIEGLHNALSTAVSSGLIRGVKFGLLLSFEFKINIHKSNFYGIGVSDVDVSSMASNSGCASGQEPADYRKVPAEYRLAPAVYLQALAVYPSFFIRGLSENRPPILNKDNYVPWSSRLLRYATSKPNGKLLVNSILLGPYHTDEELTEMEVKQMEADDQAIQTILMGLPEDIYATVDSCETA